MNFFRKTLHYLNDRNHRLLPKNLKFTKIVLIIAVCLTATFSIKTIFAADTNDTGREETTTTVSNPYNSETAKKYDEAEAALDEKNINSQVWGKSNFINEAVLVTQAGLGTSRLSTVTTSSWTPGGFIGMTNKTIASLYTPPASGVEYIASSINSILGKPVYAQNNDGFNQLKGIQSLWKICRNTVYTLISIVFVVMGLLIMLRIKISPQATVTVQNSIPKIITTLVLVTFSYAICGLIIDLTYLVEALVLSLILQASNSTANIPDISTLVKGQSGTYLSLMWNTFFSSATAATDVVLGLLGGVAGALIAAFSLAGGPIAGIIGFALGVAILVIFIIIQLLKFLIGCAKAYIILIIKIISAPLEIFLGAFPNSKINFGSWFIQTIAYASVFPISLIFLVILRLITNAVAYNNLWTPGVLQGASINPFISGILAIAGLSILAKLPDLIPEAIFQIKPSPFGKAVGENIFASSGRAAASGLGLYVGQNLASAPKAMFDRGRSALHRADVVERKRERVTGRVARGQAAGRYGRPDPGTTNSGVANNMNPEEHNY